MQNSMVVFTFSVLHQKRPFWANLIQKIKTVSLSWNLVPRLIRIWRIQQCCSLFLFYNRNTFSGQICFKKSKWLIFCLKNKLPNLDWTFYVTWINFLLMKQKLINFNWNVNNLIVHNLLITYLNLKKSQYRSSFSPLFCSLQLFLKIRSSH